MAMPVWGLIFVRRGRLAFSILSEEGREITVFRVEKGSACILSAACVLQSLEFESQITAEVNADISILPAPILSRLMNANRDVERLVYKQAVGQYSSVLHTMQQIIFLSLEKRLPPSFWRRASGGNPRPSPPPTSRSPGTSAPPGRWSPGCSTSLPAGASSPWAGNGHRAGPGRAGRHHPMTSYHKEGLE